MAIRRPLKFTSADGVTVFTFPLNNFEWQPDQGLYTPTERLTGAHYDFDLLGGGQPVKQSGREVMRWSTVNSNISTLNTAIDNMRSQLMTIGRGKLYTTDGTTLRWAWARPVAMPQMRIAAGLISMVPVTVEFRRDSDWYSDTATIATGSASSPLTVTNAGTSRVFNAIVTLFGPFTTNFVITNGRNNYKLQSTSAAATSAGVIRFDAGRNRVELSTNGGLTFATDFSHFVRASRQIQLMVLETGDNSFSVTGATGTLKVEFYPAFH